MKKTALLLSLALATAGIAGASQETKPETTKATKPAMGKTHEVQAEVASVDATAKTLTIKGEKENKTVPVKGKAVAGLKDLKAGDKVTLTCQDNEKGEHQAVIAIAPAKK